jgi:hypothetical protein
MSHTARWVTQGRPSARGVIAMGTVVLTDAQRSILEYLNRGRPSPERTAQIIQDFREKYHELVVALGKEEADRKAKEMMRAPRGRRRYPRTPVFKDLEARLRNEGTHLDDDEMDRILLAICDDDRARGRTRRQTAEYLTTSFGSLTGRFLSFDWRNIRD